MNAQVSLHDEYFPCLFFVIELNLFKTEEYRLKLQEADRHL